MRGNDYYIERGHLHFEARSSALLGTGLQGRFDPIPFYNQIDLGT